MPLNDAAIRRAKAGKSPFKLTDSHGLYLEIRPTGAKLWRYRYRIDGKENVFAAGEYCVAPNGETPEQAEHRRKGGRLTLAEARVLRLEWRGLVKQGKHPAHERQARKAEQILEGGNTFEAVAREWLAKKGKSWTQRNRDRIERTLKREVFKSIGKLPIRSVSPAHILAIMQRVEAAGAPTMAILIRQWCYRIFNHAIATLRAGTNPAAGDIREAVKPPPVRNHPALTRDDFPVLMERLAGYKGERATVLALRLLVLTFVRSAELRGAEWKEFDLDRAEWRIPVARMKMRQPHIVPLSTQAVALLRNLHSLTGRSRFLFPNSRDPNGFMAATTLNAALVRLGYGGKFSPHGFRATASTILNEMGFRPDWIERQLAHKSRDTVRAIYNRAEYLAERTQMMQQWADMVDTMSALDKRVIAGRFGKAA
jgi:integrase